MEALKHTGSTKFFVPFEFIETHSKSLAARIQNNYPRYITLQGCFSSLSIFLLLLAESLYFFSVSEELTNSVRQYLGDHGIDIAAQLIILHLPKSRFVLLTELTRFHLS